MSLLLFSTMKKKKEEMVTDGNLKLKKEWSALQHLDE